MHGNLRQVIRPHVWYFVADDCGGTVSHTVASSLAVPVAKLSPLHFDWEGVITQQSGSHFSHEYRGSLYICVFHIICYSVVFYYAGLRQVREMRRGGKIHFMLQMLNICLLAELSSSFLHLGHLAVYRQKGIGLPKLDALSEMLSVTSQIILSTVLILIAQGYSLNSAATGLPQLPVRSVFAVVSSMTLAHVVLVRKNAYVLL